VWLGEVYPAEGPSSAPIAAADRYRGEGLRTPTRLGRSRRVRRPPCV